jgi:hypothetical protein
MKFLKEIAGSFYSREGQKISEICFVFPGRRAALFFQKELSEVAERPLFSPAVLTINDLFTRLSGLRVANSLSAFTRYLSASSKSPKTISPQKINSSKLSLESDNSVKI